MVLVRQLGILRYALLKGDIPVSLTVQFKMKPFSAVVSFICAFLLPVIAASVATPSVYELRAFNALDTFEPDGVVSFSALNETKPFYWDRGNAWLDEYLASHRQDIARLIGDFRLPDAEFQAGPAHIRIYNGFVRNLENVFRLGDWQLVNVKDGELFLNLLLGVDDAYGGYDCFAKMGLIGIRKKISVYVQKIRVKVEASQFFGTLGNEGLEGENLLNSNVGGQIRLHLVGIHVDVRALGFPFDQVFTIIANEIVKRIKHDIQNLIKTPIRNFIYKINGFPV